MAKLCVRTALESFLSFLKKAWQDSAQSDNLVSSCEYLERGHYLEAARLLNVVREYLVSSPNPSLANRLSHAIRRYVITTRTALIREIKEHKTSTALKSYEALALIDGDLQEIEELFKDSDKSPLGRFYSDTGEWLKAAEMFRLSAEFREAHESYNRYESVRTSKYFQAINLERAKDPSSSGLLYQLGYYNDALRSARTFRDIEVIRKSIPLVSIEGIERIAREFEEDGFLLEAGALFERGGDLGNASRLYRSVSSLYDLERVSEAIRLIGRNRDVLGESHVITCSCLCSVIAQANDKAKSSNNYGKKNELQSLAIVLHPGKVFFRRDQTNAVAMDVDGMFAMHVVFRNLSPVARRIVRNFEADLCW